jgi:hypothetical protein
MRGSAKGPAFVEWQMLRSRDRVNQHAGSLFSRTREALFDLEAFSAGQLVSDASGGERRERSARGMAPQLEGESPSSNLVEVKD